MRNTAHTQKSNKSTGSKRMGFWLLICCVYIILCAHCVCADGTRPQGNVTGKSIVNSFANAFKSGGDAGKTIANAFKSGGDEDKAIADPFETGGSKEAPAVWEPLLPDSDHPEKPEQAGSKQTEASGIQADPGQTEVFGVQADPGQTEASEVQDDPDFCETVTLMVYMIGSDLESAASAATNDMEEIAGSGIDSDNVTVLIYTGGATEWHSDVPVDVNTLFLLEDGGYRQLETYESTSMGDPESLRRFLQYGYENYPADSYDLILWDHGNGPVIGYGSDRLFEGDALTLPEMREALEHSPFGSSLSAAQTADGKQADSRAADGKQADSGTADGKQADSRTADGKQADGRASGGTAAGRASERQKTGEKLSFIGFDACLMASAELVCTVADYADYLIASQETEPSFGWNYAFLEDLGHRPAGDIAAEIVDHYIAFCEEYFRDKEFFQSDVTLAAIDLSRAGELEEAIDGLFAAAKDDVSGDFNKLAVARVHSHGLGRASTGSEYDLVDLGSLLTEMSSRYPKQTEAIQAIVEDSVISTRANIDGCCGMSLFYPYYNKNYYEAQWKDAYASLGLFPDYLEYLRRYGQIWLGTDLKEAFTEKMQPVKGDKPSVYQMQLTDEQYEQFAQARYYILERRGEGLYAPVFLSANVSEHDGLLTADFNGKAIYAKDDFGEVNLVAARAWDSTGEITDYSVVGTRVERGELSEPEIVRCDLQLAVNEKTAELTVKGLYEGDDDGNIAGGKKQPVFLDEWDRLAMFNVRERYLTRDESGRIIDFWEWPEGDILSWNEYPVTNGIHFTYEPIYDNGSEYYVMFDIQDVHGNHFGSELMPVALEDAPVIRRDKTVRALNWTDGNACAFIDESGIKAEIMLVKDVTGGENFYTIELQNSNEYPVTLKMNDLVADDAVKITSSVYVTADPRSHTSSTIPYFTESYLAAGSDCERMKKLSFVLELDRHDTGAYLIRQRAVELNKAANMKAEVIVEPILDVRAEEQVLTEMQNVRVRLQSLGFPKQRSEDPESDIANIRAEFLIENLGTEEREVSVLAMECNGASFQINAAAHLRGGSCWHTFAWFYRSKLCGLTDNAWSKRPERMSSISSVRLLVDIEGVPVWCPVILAEKGDGSSKVVSDSLSGSEVLYQNNELEIRLYDKAADPPADKREEPDWLTDDSDKDVPDGTEHPEHTVWDIWIVNKSERIISVILPEEGVETKEMSSERAVVVGPGASILAEKRISWNYTVSEYGDLQIRAVVRYSGREEVFETEPFILPLAGALEIE